jgi:hypothetical protein
MCVHRPRVNRSGRYSTAWTAGFGYKRASSCMRQIERKLHPAVRKKLIASILGGRTDRFIVGLYSPHFPPNIRMACPGGQFAHPDWICVPGSIVASVCRSHLGFPLNPRSKSLRHLSQVIIIQWASVHILLTKFSSTGSSTCKPRADRSTPLSHKSRVVQIFNANAVQLSAELNGSIVLTLIEAFGLLRRRCFNATILHSFVRQNERHMT